ncbi:MAG: hypothetical protein PVF63_07225 [Gammaproteobacteria bacterium]|jgi:hypothetical protein
MTTEATGLYWRWVLACTVGELIGFFGLPVLGGMTVLWLTEGIDPFARSIVLYLMAAAGGLGEGAILAFFQVHILRLRWPALNTRRWIIYTAVAASIAWLCGMLSPLLDDLMGLSAAVQIAIWLPAGTIIVFSIGTAQSRVLSDVVSRPRRWITANVMGWLLGLPWTFVLPAMLPESAPLTVWAIVFFVAAALMGLTVGLVTGTQVLRLQDR